MGGLRVRLSIAALAIWISMAVVSGGAAATVTVPPHVVHVDAGALQMDATDQVGSYTARYYNNGRSFAPTSIPLDCVFVPDGVPHVVLASGSVPSGTGSSTEYDIAVSDRGGPTSGSVSVTVRVILSGTKTNCPDTTASLTAAAGVYVIVP